VVHRHQSPAQSVPGSVCGDLRRGGTPLPPLRRGVAWLLDSYKYWISPLLPSACRFHPTCSVYMREAVERYGVAKGVWLGLGRLVRCHPFHPGGYDPVR